MRWLIIGSNSFSGASFISYLLSCGEEVTGISRSQEIRRPFKVYEETLSANERSQFTFYQVDLNTDVALLEDIITNVSPQIIINFAAQSMVAQSWEFPKHWFDTNASSFCDVLQVLGRCKSLKKYVHFSTPEVYGSTSQAIGETTAFNPTTPYAISRAAGDFLVRAYREAYDLPAIITRASNVYGSGQQLYRLIPRAILLALTGGKLTLDGGGSSDRDFIHIHDVSAALYKLATGDTASNEFHISTENQIKIYDLVTKIGNILGKPIDDFVEMGPERLGKDTSYDLSSELLRKETGWSPQIPLSTGLESVVSWVKENQNVLTNLPKDYIHKR